MSIELFDVNATVLDSFNGLRELDQFEGGGFRSGKGTFGGEFHADRLPRFFVPRPYCFTRTCGFLRAARFGRQSSHRRSRQWRSSASRGRHGILPAKDEVVAKPAEFSQLGCYRLGPAPSSGALTHALLVPSSRRRSVLCLGHDAIEPRRRRESNYRFHSGAECSRATAGRGCG